MIAYVTRTLPVAVRALIGARSPGGSPAISVLKRRVRPHQIDFNLHMNQAAYAAVMELGRTDWVLRFGGWRRWRAQQITPVVAEQRIVYRRELKPFAAYVLDTRATGVDGRLLTFSHHLLVGDQVRARGEAKLIFVGPDGVIDPERVPALCEDLLADPLSVEGWRVDRA